MSVAIVRTHFDTLLEVTGGVRGLEFLNALATAPHYEGVRYLVSFLGLVFGVVKVIGPLLSDYANRSRNVNVATSTRQPSYEGAFTNLADLHIELQSRYADLDRRFVDAESTHAHLMRDYAALLAEVAVLRTRLLPADLQLPLDAESLAADESTHHG